MLHELFGEGRYHIIPSFFRTLMYLKKNKKEFSIVFRTFGTDLNKTLFEFNKFCDGQHPCFNGRNNTPLVKFDGTKATKDLRINKPEQKGCYYRPGSDLKDSILVTGTHDRVTDMLDLNLQADQIDDVNVHKEAIDAYQAVVETLKKSPSMAIYEDYPNWKANDLKRDFAKLLLIDQADYNTHHIFFDDNADEEDDCIVDVRDVVTQERIPYQKFIDLYVVKVHPHRAILEPEYFIKMIE